MDKELTAKANPNQNASEIPELNMDELNRISGGKMNDTYREMFISMVAEHKKIGVDQRRCPKEVSYPRSA